MNLQIFKDDIQKAGFSKEGLDFINMIVDTAIKRGDERLKKEERDEIVAVIDLEIENAKLEAGTKKQIVGVLDEFADNIEEAIVAAIGEIEALEEKPPAGN